MGVVGSNPAAPINEYKGFGRSNIGCGHSCTIRNLTKEWGLYRIKGCVALLSWLQEYYGEQAATETEGFIDWLSENMEPSTVKERLGSLKATWDWGIEEDLVTENPWTDIKTE